MTAGALAAGGFELAVAAAGLWVLWAAVLAPAARRRRARRLTPWEVDWSDFGVFLCCVFVGITVPSAAAAYFLRSAHLDADRATVLGGAVMHGGWLLGLYGFWRGFGERSPPAGPLRGPRAAARTGVLTFLLAMPIVDLASFLWDHCLTALHLPDDRQDMVTLLQNSHSPLLVGSLLVIATLLVPVTEEITFRAGLFRFLRTRMPRGLALALTSLLFGLAHQSWSGFVPLTVLAVIFALAYERTGSIWTTIIAHALFNLNTFVIIGAGIDS